ncbi:hypothetical protein SAMD00023353_1001590 [Rosellinia necatrix]|uniref:Uncharacterized protein n=1 Tax=Rosellinia necatrix TaxID=77044 RepID=A0A1S8A6G2_ROSNE|nr:hypothetical protein SAMD00023353_1001590 [Rosellinia necatrix]
MDGRGKGRGPPLREGNRLMEEGGPRSDIGSERPANEWRRQPIGAEMHRAESSREVQQRLESRPGDFDVRHTTWTEPTSLNLYRKCVEKNDAAPFKLYETSRTPGSNEASD